MKARTIRIASTGTLTGVAGWGGRPSGSVGIAKLTCCGQVRTGVDACQMNMINGACKQEHYSTSEYCSHCKVAQCYIQFVNLNQVIDAIVEQINHCHDQLIIDGVAHVK